MRNPRKLSTASRDRFLPGIAKDLVRLPLFYNAWYILGGNLVPGIAGLIFWTLAGRLYSASDVGIASAVISAASLVAMIAGLGTNIGLIRFIPVAPRPRHLISSVLSVNFVAATLGGLIFLGGTQVWAIRLRPALGSIPFVLAFFAYLVFSTVGTSIRDTFIAYRRSNYSMAYTLIANGLRLLLLLVGIHFGSLGLVGAVSASVTVAFLVSLYILSPRVSPEIRWFPRFSWSSVSPILPFSISNMITTALINLTPTIIPLLTLQLLGAEANAYSYMAMMLGTVVASPGIAIAVSAFAEGANDYQQARANLTRALWVSLAITLIVGIGMVIIAPWILSWFPAGYSQEGTQLLRWLVLASPFTVMIQIYVAHLRLEKRGGALVAISALQMAVTLSTICLLASAYGILANGFGILLGGLLTTLVCLADYLRGRAPLPRKRAGF